MSCLLAAKYAGAALSAVTMMSALLLWWPADSVMCAAHFVALMGAITVFPIAFTLTLMMYVKVSSLRGDGSAPCLSSASAASCSA